MRKSPVSCLQEGLKLTKIRYQISFLAIFPSNKSVKDAKAKISPAIKSGEEL